jgi:D-aminoacyl-tRNA deacylase
MKAIVQRVARASVSVDGKVVGRCGQGLLLLLAAHRNDTEREAERFAGKVVNLRIFNDSEGKMNLSLKDLPPQDEPAVLAISNFTVYGETAKNRRPSFVEAAPYERGKELFERAVEAMQILGLSVQTGTFGAHMDVELVNDGPVTIVLEVPPATETGV